MYIVPKVVDYGCTIGPKEVDYGCNIGLKVVYLSIYLFSHGATLVCNIEAFPAPVITWSKVSLFPLFP